MPGPGRLHRSLFASLAAAAFVVAGCGDDLSAPKTIPTPIGPMENLGTVMVDVNLKTGVITTRPITTGSLAPSPRVSAALYGSSGLISHVFQLQAGAPVGPTYIMRDHIENRERFAIGTHLPHTAGAFPEDTMGVFVFVSIPPVVTGGCTPGPSCKVAVDSGYDGRYTFTSVTAQPYMYFKTILEADDGVTHQGLDFTDQSPANSGPPGGIDYFRRLAFRTSGGVTDYHFGVSVSAPFVKPNESVYTVNYAGDSLPNRIGTDLSDLRSEQDWRVAGSVVSDTSIAVSLCPIAGRCLHIVHNAPAVSATDSLIYFRSDSLGASDVAYVDAFIAVSNLQNGNPSVYMGMQDKVKLISFGIAADKVGFTSGANTFLASSVPGTSALLSAEYRITKFGTDSVVGYVNGTPKSKVLYSALPAAPVSPVTPFFWFGNRVTYNAAANPAFVTSNWSTVQYVIGAAHP